MVRHGSGVDNGTMPHHLPPVLEQEEVALCLSRSMSPAFGASPSPTSSGAPRAPGTRWRNSLSLTTTINPDNCCDGTPAPEPSCADPRAEERLGWKYYTALPDGGVTVDLDAFRRSGRRPWISPGSSSPEPLAGLPQFGCFGLHEWAMAYKSGLNGIRQRVSSGCASARGDRRRRGGSRIRCSHFDAFRFYTRRPSP
jgi:hypothetical protein